MVSLKSVRKYLANIAFGYQNARWGRARPAECVALRVNLYI